MKNRYVFLILAAIFGLLSWRLFVIGSANQLFLYGDALQFLNSLTNYVRDLHFHNLFGDFIGKNGLFGAYALSDPQSSIFYPPLLGIVILGKLLHLGPIALYYLLLLNHSLHFITGAFFIYLIAYQLFKVEQRLALVGGVVYLTIGWNVLWMDGGSLVFMIGWVPVLMYVLLNYLQQPTKRRLLWYLLAFGGFLYAGGLVNFFFYVWLNGVLLFVLGWLLDIPAIHSIRKSSELRKIGLLAFLVVPILGLLLYSVQLVATLMIAGDVTHSATTYDYLAFFGLHYTDLIGLIFPRFGLLGFGATSSPQLKLNEGSLEYIGMLPLLLLSLAAFYLRRKEVMLLLGLLILNLLLCFGGQTALYHLAFQFPGNSTFRGNYKWLIYVGFYIALLVPLTLHYLGDLTDKAKKNIQGGVGWVLRVLFIFTIIGALAYFATAVLKTTSLPQINDFYLLAQTVSTYLLRALLFLGIAGLLLKYLLEVKRIGTGLYLLMMAFLLVDGSVAYIYAQRYQMPIWQLVNPTIFVELQGKTVYNALDQYSQIYQIPEVLQINTLGAYTPLPNSGLRNFSEQVWSAGKRPRIELLRAAGVQVVVTTEDLSTTAGLTLLNKRPLTEDYKNLYLYKANGDINNEWGPIPAYANSSLYFYAVDNVLPAHLFGSAQGVEDPAQELAALSDSNFQANKPFVLGKTVGAAGASEGTTSLETNDPTNKTYSVNSSSGGLLITQIPYSKIWKSTVGGAKITPLRADGAFIAVPVTTSGNQNVHIYVDTRPLWLGAVVSLLTLIGTIWLLWPLSKIKSWYIRRKY